MPSLGHAAVGLAAGRLHAGSAGPRLAATVVMTALATFPDLDVLARQLGVGRGSPWLHRGALHSLAVAVAAGALAALLAGGLGRSRARMFLTGALVVASHGLLDAFTTGGAGSMLLWPFTTERFLAPVFRILPAAPLGLRFLGSRGLEVALREAVLFSPLLVYGLWPRGRRSPHTRRGDARSPGLPAAPERS